MIYAACVVYQEKIVFSGRLIKYSETFALCA